MKSNIAPWNMMVGRQAFLLGVCLFSGAMSNVWGVFQQKSKRLVDFHGFHVGKSTSPMDPMLNKSPLFQQKSSISKTLPAIFAQKTRPTSPRLLQGLRLSTWRLRFGVLRFRGEGGWNPKAPLAGFWGLSFFLGGVGKKRWKKGINMVSKDFWNFAEIFFVDEGEFGWVFVDKWWVKWARIICSDCQVSNAVHSGNSWHSHGKNQPFW